MDKESIHKWLQQAVQDGQLTSDYYLSQLPDDSFGWGRILTNMWFAEGETRPSGSGLLLTGPAGCGKHTALHHMIFLLSRRNYQFIFLDGNDLNDADESIEKLNALLDQCHENQSGLCLVLEEVAQQPYSPALYKYLGNTLCQYYLSRGEESRLPGPKDHPLQQWENDSLPGLYHPFFLVLIEEEEPRLPALLRNRLQTCRMTLPTFKQRLAFIENHELGNIQTQEGFLEQTDGLSYGQLEDLINSLRAFTAGADIRSEDSLNALVADQKEFLAQQLLPKQSLSAGLQSESAMDQMIELFSRLLPVSSGSSQTDTAPEFLPSAHVLSSEQYAADPDGYLETAQKDYEAMPIRQLLEETFGKENTADLTNNELSSMGKLKNKVLQ